MLDAVTLQELANIVGPEHLHTDQETIERYSGDALTPFRAFWAEGAFENPGDAVIQPASAAEVAEIIKLAARRGFPVVPQSGGTGVMGGVVPLRGGVILDLKRLNRIIEISPADLTATVEAGVILQDLTDALAQHGLMHGHDPYSVAIAAVAGTISTNGVGYRAAAFGPMGQQVVALEVVLPDGRILNTRPVPKYSAGPNLNHLFIGAEGTLGVITRATIRVWRQPEEEAFASVSFASFDQGFAAAAEMLALGIHPTLLDVTEEDGIVTMFLVFEGFREGVAAHCQRALQVAQEFGGRDIGPAAVLDYWEHRHDSGANYKRSALLRPRQARWARQRRWSFDYLHLGLPTSKALEYRRRCDELMRGKGVKVAEYAIWSRPEMFSMMLIPTPDAGENYREELARVVDQILTLAQDMGGVMEYCHGVGVKLNHLLAREMGVGHDVLRQLKQTLDPANILNPGKLGL